MIIFIYQICSIHWELQENYFYLSNKNIYLNIVGCPAGYGSTKNKHQSEECSTNTFNLLSNHSIGCKSCDQDKNKGIKCNDGLITVEYNYWMGVTNQSFRIRVMSMAALASLDF